jgi:hypothetical protein
MGKIGREKQLILSNKSVKNWRTQQIEKFIV